MISHHVATTLFLPECRVSRGHDPSVTATMHMPEATVHKDRLPCRRYHDVRFSRERFSMKTIANAQVAEQCSHSEFRLCVFAPNRCHAAAALRLGKNIRHAKRFLTKLTNSSMSRSRMSERGYCPW